MKIGLGKGSLIMKVILSFFSRLRHCPDHILDIQIEETENLTVIVLWKCYINTLDFCG